MIVVNFFGTKVSTLVVQISITFEKSAKIIFFLKQARKQKLNICELTIQYGVSCVGYIEFPRILFALAKKNPFHLEK
jgi:hypothetical protein